MQHELCRYVLRWTACYIEEAELHQTSRHFVDCLSGRWFTKLAGGEENLLEDITNAHLAAGAEKIVPLVISPSHNGMH